MSCGQARGWLRKARPHLEHGEGLVAGDDHALEGLLLLHSVGHPRLDGLGVGFAQRAVAHVAVVVESLLERRPDAEVDTVLQLQCLAEDVGGRVPEGLFAFGVVEGAEPEAAVALERPEQVPLGAIHHGDDDLLGEGAADRLGDLERSCDALDTVLLVPVGEGDLDGDVSLLRGQIGACGVQGAEERGWEGEMAGRSIRRGKMFIICAKYGGMCGASVLTGRCGRTFALSMASSSRWWNFSKISIRFL